MVHFTVNVRCREHSVLLEMAPHLYCRGFFSLSLRGHAALYCCSLTQRCIKYKSGQKNNSMILSGFGDKGIPQWHLL